MSKNWVLITNKTDNEYFIYQDVHDKYERFKQGDKLKYEDFNNEKSVWKNGVLAYRGNT